MLEIKNVTRVYKPKKGQPVKALDDVSLKFPDTGLIFILGKSGSGKSTLLNVMGGLDKLDEGEIIIKGKSSKDFTQADFDSYRNTYLGFIFQEYNILNEFNVGQNIALALELQGKKATSEEVNKILEEVDLVDFGKRKPNEMSGGQKQRIAIARALVKNPDIIMADEPTGALDSKTGLQVFDTLKKLSKTKLVIVVSHDREFAELYGDRVIEFKDGKVISDIEKYLEDSQVKNENVSVIDNKFIQIKQGYKLTKEDVELINDYLQKNSAIISVDEMSNRDVKKFARINDLGQKESFKDTNENEIVTKTGGFKLIKSRLPFKASLKMGASSLKTKPFRLFITILLSFVAFAFFGIVDTMNAYDRQKTATESLIESNTPSVAIFKEYVDGWKNTSLKEEEVLQIEQKAGKKGIRIVNIAGGSWSHDLQNFLDTSTYNMFSATRVSGWACIDDVDYPIIAGRKPQLDNEIVITKCQYNEYATKGYNLEYYDYELDKNVSIKYKTSEIDTPEKFIEKDISIYIEHEEDTFAPILLKVVGIIDTGFDVEKYKTKEGEAEGLGYMVKSIEFQADTDKTLNTAIFRTKSFIDSHMRKILVNEISETYCYLYEKTDDVIDSSKNQYFSKIITDKYVLESKNGKIYLADGANTPLARNQVLLNIRTLVDEELRKIEYYSEHPNYEILINISAGCLVYNSETNEYDYKPELIDQAIESGVINIDKKYFNLKNENKWPNIDEQVEVVGYYYYKNADNYLLLSDEFFKENRNVVNNPYISVNYDIQDDETFAKSLINNFYEDSLKQLDWENINDSKITLRCASLAIVENVDGLLESLQQVFLIIAIICAVFSALLLANFITISISYKKREIGVLRAIGARGIDVYNVFFNEAMIIALINFAIALFAAIFTTNYINNMIINDYAFPMKLMSFGVRQIILMLVISIATAAISTFLPVFMTARKRPSEAIRTA